MGTSNWQNIPFCVDALMKMEPARVLDIGVGFGRWGIMIREFCEVWFNKVHAKDWEIDIQGIEAFEPNIEDHQRLFYSKIHIGDAADVLPGLDGRFDVILYGDVLEHFKRDVALKMLETSLDRAHYVMVNIPLGEEWEQEEMYGNPYEAHLSEWTPEDFRAMDLSGKRPSWTSRVAPSACSSCLARTRRTCAARCSRRRPARRRRRPRRS